MGKAVRLFIKYTVLFVMGFIFLYSTGYSIYLCIEGFTDTHYVHYLLLLPLLSYVFPWLYFGLTIDLHMLFYNVFSGKKLLLLLRNYMYFVAVILVLSIPYLALIPWNTIEFSYSKLLLTIHYSFFLTIITYFITPLYHGFSITRHIFFNRNGSILSITKTLKIIWRLKTSLLVWIILGFFSFIILHILFNGFYNYVLKTIFPNPYLFYIDIDRELYYISPTYRELFLRYNPTLSLPISIVFSLIIYLEIIVKKYIYRVEEFVKHIG